MNELQFILYKLPDEEGKVQVIIKDETIGAPQKAMAQLFGVSVPAISKHLAHIFVEKELDVDVVVSKMEITTPHGLTYRKFKMLPNKGSISKEEADAKVKGNTPYSTRRNPLFQVLTKKSND